VLLRQAQDLTDLIRVRQCSSPDAVERAARFWDPPEGDLWLYRYRGTDPDHRENAGLRKPVVRGSRIPVELPLSLLAQGVSHAEILDDYPDLVEEDLLACLAYARAVIGRDSLEPIEVRGD